MERKSSYGVLECDTNRRELLVKTGGVNDKASRKTYNFDMVSAESARLPRITLGSTSHLKIPSTTNVVV